MPLVVTMAVGDSIAMGSTTYRGGWRRLLNDRAPNLAMVGRNCTDGTFGYTVGQHEGYSGAQTTTFASIAFADAYAPSLVLLQLGTNDISDGTRTVAEILVDVLELAEAFLAKSYCTRVLVMNIPPRASGNAKFAQTVEYRTDFAVVMAGGSAGISSCDPWSTVANPGADFTDSLHPSEVGYAKAPPAILAALRVMDVQTKADRYARGARGGGPGYT